MNVESDIGETEKNAVVPEGKGKRKQSKGRVKKKVQDQEKQKSPPNKDLEKDTRTQSHVSYHFYAHCNFFLK